MRRNVLKINSYFLTTIGLLAIIAATVYMFKTISVPSDPDSWDDLGKFVVEFATIIIYILSSPLIISGIWSLYNLKGKNNYRFCMIFNIIGIVLYGLFILLFIFLDVLYLFVDNYRGYINIGLKDIIPIMISFIFVCLLILNSILLYKEKNNK